MNSQLKKLTKTCTTLGDNIKAFEVQYKAEQGQSKNSYNDANEQGGCDTKDTKSTKLTKSHVKIYTDGSFMNRKPQIAGYGVYFANVDIDDISEPFTVGTLTNQRAELYAIYKGIQTVIKKCNFEKLTVFTDSMYSINSITNWIHSWKKNGWVSSSKKPVANKDIIKKIDNYTSNSKYKNKIDFKHVKGHSGNKGNDKADELATSGALRS